MTHRFSNGKFRPKNLEKYVGNNMPTWRSSWEWTFMNFCDTNPNILKWASEAVRIPYRCPITGKNTNYVPDFFIQYIDKNGTVHVELIEVKPSSQTHIDKVGKSRNNQIEYVRNVAKWRAAQAWCKHQGITFRILNETDLFWTGKR